MAAVHAVHAVITERSTEMAPPTHTTVKEYVRCAAIAQGNTPETCPAPDVFPSGGALCGSGHEQRQLVAAALQQA